MPCCSAAVVTTSPTIISTAIAEYSASPAAGSDHPPNVNTRPAGISRMESTWTKPEKAVGFSNGKAELTLKKPPPLVPSCLIEICEAAGPMARV